MNELIFETCKNMVAAKYSYSSWDKMVNYLHQTNAGSWQTILRRTEEATNIYAAIHENSELLQERERRVKG